MTAGSRGDQTMRWLRIAALVVIALVAMRTATSFRALHPLVASSAGTTEVATSLTDGAASRGDTVVEARPVRRARQLQPGIIPFLAVLMLFALGALARGAGRPEVRVPTRFASRAVPVTGGRGPPLLLH